jgi:mannitol/fructose-specific phosphotransferase system IIA component (Ntr-type)
VKLSSILDPNLIICSLKSKNREEAINELISALEKSVKAVSADAIKTAVNEREALSSTVMAPGIAFPHARVGGISDLSVAIGTSKSGIDYDGQEVNLIALFVVSEGETNLYLKAMAGMSKVLSTAGMLQKLVDAEESDDLIKIIEQTKIEVEPTIIAEDIMQKDFPSLRPDQTLREAADLFVTTGRESLAVVKENGEYAGVIRSDDILKVGLPSYLAEMDDISFISTYEPFEQLLKQETTLKVDDVIVKENTTKTYMVHTPIIQVAIGLEKTPDQIAPILSENGTLAGIITPADFIVKIIRA